MTASQIQSQLELELELNISNANTVGFKSSKAVFSDLFSTILANGSTTRQLGRGSQLSGSLKEFSQGAFEASTNALDMAIDGSGFFVVNNGISFFNISISCFNSFM